MRSKLWNGLAAVLCVGVILSAVVVGQRVYENLPHLEDEFAYLWQARVMAEGDLSLPSPDFPKSFLIPFVIDHQGQRFGKYPPGWPAALSLGVRAGITALVNPLLAGLAVWLTYLLGKRTLDARTGFLGAVLLASSPLLLIQAGSLLSHTWSLVLAASFFLMWLASLEEQAGNHGVIPAAAGGICLGLLGLTRPLTGLAIGIPFLIGGMFHLVRGPGWKRKRVLLIGGISLLLLGLYPVWQYAVTGSFTTNPYTLWWPYDKYGFGPGFGVTEAGHTLIQGWRNTRYSLRVGASDMFGWLKISWIFLPFGIWAARKSHLTWYSLGISVSLVLLYLGYWVGSWLLGSRYYFEALPGLALLTAAGISWLAGWNRNQKTVPENNPRGITWRSALMVGILGLLIFSNLYFYLPARLGGLKGLYGIERTDLIPFESEAVRSFQPALVIVDSEHWMPYGSLLTLESPRLNSPYIFAWSMGSRTDRRLADAYREDRNILYYYPDRDRFRLFSSPVNGSLIE